MKSKRMLLHQLRFLSFLTTAICMNFYNLEERERGAITPCIHELFECYNERCGTVLPWFWVAARCLPQLVSLSACVLQGTTRHQTYTRGHSFSSWPYLDEIFGNLFLASNAAQSQGS